MAFPFLSNGTFLRVPLRDASQPFAIAGIAWDGCVTNRPGARFGPASIRTASQMLCDGIHPYFDVTPGGVTTDYGDFELPNTNLESMRAKLAEKLPPLLNQHHMIFLGGDHSITLPVLRAQRAKLGVPLACIHFDAHCDAWEDHFGEPSGHGTWVYEAIREGVIQKECTFQFGIRSSGERKAREYVSEQGGMIFTARNLRGLFNDDQLKPVLDAVKSRLEAHKFPPLYITLDIDCLDPSVAPGTGTPEPGGLATSQVLTLLEHFSALPNCVGMDCVEVAPAYDHAEITSQAACSFVWTYLCGQIAKGKPTS